MSVQKSEKGFFVRLPQELLDALNRFSETNNIPKAQIVENALRQYLAAPAGEDKKPPTLKQIITKYKGKCTRCGRAIEIGEIAFWGSGILVCYECYAHTSGHLPDVKKALKAYAEYKKAKALAQEARNELDRLVTKINVYEVFTQLSDIVHKIDGTLQLIHEYAMNVEKSADLEAVKNTLLEINSKLEEILAARALLMREEKKREKRLEHV
jgi:hypothetical protein